MVEKQEGENEWARGRESDIKRKGGEKGEKKRMRRERERGEAGVEQWVKIEKVVQKTENYHIERQECLSTFF